MFNTTNILRGLAALAFGVVILLGIASAFTPIDGDNAGTPTSSEASPF